jgi:D-alanyl-D-alanine carboxypeptidase
MLKWPRHALCSRFAPFQIVLLSACILLFGAWFGHPAAAQIGSDRYSSIVIDAQSGDVLEAASADELRYPASLTKMMTIYMLFEALRDRRISLNQIVPVSAHSASMSPSKLGLLPGSVITVEQALLGLVTKSANDAAAALGEMMGGDEDRFAQMMTLRARALGMSHTTFRNASGLPDSDQLTTARDLALLARHLVQDYPIEYRYFSVPNFVFHGRTIWNHDRMLQSYPGVDGLKTGYTDASGCNLATSAVRGDVRLIGIVLGASNGSERDIHMAALLDQGYERLGVPIGRYEAPPPRFPALVASASAATLPRPYLRLAAVHGFERPYMQRHASRSANMPVSARERSFVRQPSLIPPSRSSQRLARHGRNAAAGQHARS